MNREYILIGIAKGRTTAKVNNIILTDKEKRELTDIEKKQKKAKEEGRSIVFYASDED